MTRAAIPRLPLAHWPGPLREAWCTNVGRQPWRPRYAGTVRAAVERWFGWAGAGALPSPSGVAAYERALRERLSERTALTYLQRLAYGIQLVAPEGPWGWLVRGVLDRLPRPAPRDRPARTRTAARVGLPVAEWPAPWRARWQALCGAGAGRRFRRRRADPTAHWSAAYRRRIERGVGQLAAYARAHDVPPELTEDLVHDFLDWCADRGVSGQSMGMYAEEIYRAFALMEPARDLRWLRELVEELAAAPAVRSKAARLIRSHEIQRAGLELMRDARRRPLTTATALRYRDGLILAVWAVRPGRLSDFAALALGDSLLVSETAATIVFHRTKNGDGQVMPWPPALFDALRVYLDPYRRHLARAAADDGRLWLGRDGAALTTGGLSRHVGDVTERLFGRRINPHLLRDGAATSIVETDPREALRASALLGHRDPRTTDRHYQHATSYAAAALAYELLAGYRMPPPARTRSRPRSSS